MALMKKICVVVQSLRHVQIFVTPWIAHTRFPCPSPSPGVCSNSCLLSRWCHPTSVVPFSSCLQSFPASGSFPLSQLLTSGGRSTGASASALVLPMNIQGWFPLGGTVVISLLSKGLSSVFCISWVGGFSSLQAEDTELSCGLWSVVCLLSVKRQEKKKSTWCKIQHSYSFWLSLSWGKKATTTDSTYLTFSDIWHCIFSLVKGN